MVMMLRMVDEKLLFYYTMPQAKKQAGNAGNAKEIIDQTSADFLPGACRTGDVRRVLIGIATAIFIYLFLGNEITARNGLIAVYRRSY